MWFWTTNSYPFPKPRTSIALGLNFSGLSQSCHTPRTLSLPIATSTSFLLPHLIVLHFHSGSHHHGLISVFSSLGFKTLFFCLLFFAHSLTPFLCHLNIFLWFSSSHSTMDSISVSLECSNLGVYGFTCPSSSRGEFDGLFTSSSSFPGAPSCFLCDFFLFPQLLALIDTDVVFCCSQIVGNSRIRLAFSSWTAVVTILLPPSKYPTSSMRHAVDASHASASCFQEPPDMLFEVDLLGYVGSTVLLFCMKFRHIPHWLLQSMIFLGAVFWFDPDLDFVLLMFWFQMNDFCPA